MKRFDLAGRSALVTGGARGIGLEIARTLRMAGASLMLADLDLDATRKAAAGVGAEVRAFRCDVADPRSVRDLAAAIGPCPDILVNNAGVGCDLPTKDISDDDWRLVISVNLDGAFYCCRTFGAAMAERGSGNIVNIGSMCGFIVAKPQNGPAYNASKAGVHMLTKNFACEWAKSGVRVNAVAPGYIATKMTSNPVSTWVELTPMGRLGRTEEIANVVQFLASDASSYMTGAILNVDGGYTSW
ncbi:MULTISPECIES: SDR family NAD(P)-dependent oxidoreductase [Mesorhizobium]|nr:MULTISPECIES: SDR family oxidoreductase [Mesorhizobium]MCF6102113.1 SDR family oxidoreductase [Mesorhizobium muleiense]RWI46069.1 MAG: SDR family oxidoreductase [Mesorhizobium sp.]RWP09579.1 MAG: SDR family oxidoreductase [Mesorhizobium sp.]TJV30389.1 MAG: SDR family oxidoreductase [Mesorhizobium sp.]TJW43110.1 MAG: SDR family oxidoreductase [Mesorhizobium sp.]